jgi:plasmid replication initiation protein
MSLTYLLITPTTDSPTDFLDEDEYVCTFSSTDDEVTESLDDAINAMYRQLWS